MKIWHVLNLPLTQITNQNVTPHHSLSFTQPKTLNLISFSLIITLLQPSSTMVAKTTFDHRCSRQNVATTLHCHSFELSTTAPLWFHIVEDERRRTIYAPHAPPSSPMRNAAITTMTTPLVLVPANTVTALVGVATTIFFDASRCHQHLLLCLLHRASFFLHHHVATTVWAHAGTTLQHR